MLSCNCLNDARTSFTGHDTRRTAGPPLGDIGGESDGGDIGGDISVEVGDDENRFLDT